MNDRLMISDFINLNQEILDKENELNRFIRPFYHKFMIPYYQDKLLQIIDNTIKNKEIIADISIIEELFSSVYTSFVPNGMFKKIMSIEYNIEPKLDITLVKGIIKINDSVTAIIKYIFGSKTFDVNFTVFYKEVYNYYNFTGKSLEASNNHTCFEYVSDLNQVIIQLVYDYIKYSIKGEQYE